MKGSRGGEGKREKEGGKREEGGGRDNEREVGEGLEKRRKWRG